MSCAHRERFRVHSGRAKSLGLGCAWKASWKRRDSLTLVASGSESAPGAPALFDSPNQPTVIARWLFNRQPARVRI